MSETQKTTEPTRRRRVRNNRSRKPKAEGASDAAAPAVKTERAPRPPREPRVNVPVPPEFFGQTKTGKIDAVINGGRGKYGFIAIDSSEARIYFSFEKYDASEFVARRGYGVEFLVSKDDTDRTCAASVKLTAEGKVQAAEREARIAAEKANPAPKRERKPAAAPAAASAAPAAGAEVGEKKKRVRAPRTKPEDDRSVSLQVSYAGVPEAKTVVAKLSQSIGKLKHAATEAFDAPTELNVFLVNAENPQGIKLTKALLRGLSDNATVELRAPTTA